MEKNCLNCKHYAQPSFEMKECCWECLRQEELYTRWERKPITNADRIRHGTDEELVDIICCQYKECKDLDADCNKCLLDWLKQEAKDGE